MVPIVHHAGYVAPTPAKHRFPMSKFGRLIEILRAEGIATTTNTIEPEPVSFDAIAGAHESTYVRDVLSQTLDAAMTRRIGFPITDALVRRSRRAIGGTILTGGLALDHGLACNTAGGSHHAHTSYGAGYCIFNDVAIAIRALQSDGHIATAMVIDLDVHQGDGTAQIFAQDDSVFTFSMHCEANFPPRKAKSDLDIALPKGVGDTAYLTALSRSLDRLLEGARPDIVFYNAGVDPHAHIYYDDATRETAAAVREALDDNFTVVLGRWRDEPVGPHPISMYQVAFEAEEFNRVLPWLALNRQGLVVFVHPITDDDYLDHAQHAIWLGEKLALKLEVFDNNKA